MDYKSIKKTLRSVLVSFFMNRLLQYLFLVGLPTALLIYSYIEKNFLTLNIKIPVFRALLIVITSIFAIVIIRRYCKISWYPYIKWDYIGLEASQHLTLLDNQNVSYVDDYTSFVLKDDYKMLLRGTFDWNGYKLKTMKLTHNKQQLKDGELTVSYKKSDGTCDLPPFFVPDDELVLTDNR